MIIRIKDYMHILNVSESTAKRYHASDRKLVKGRHVTLGWFADHYGLTRQEVVKGII